MQAALEPAGDIQAPHAPISDARSPLAGIPRPARVVYLVIVAWLLGLADLGITMTFLTSVGMFEANPIARFIIGLGSPAALIAFKLATMALTSWIVLAARARWQAESAAWICVAILGWLTVHWYGYMEFTRKTTNAIAVVTLDPAFGDGEWVTFR